MGCAIGMSLAAACEIFYWVMLKPVAKLLVNVTLTTRAKHLYDVFFLIVFLSLLTFCLHYFHLVYLAYMRRNYDLNEVA